MARYRITITPTAETKANQRDYDVILYSLTAEVSITSSKVKPETIAEGTMKDLKLPHTCEYEIERLW